MAFPVFDPDVVDSAIAGWDVTLADFMAQTKAFLNTQPTQVRSVYRDAGSNPSPGTFLNLSALPAASFKGFIVWVEDSSGDSNDPSTGLKRAYSDGTDWRYEQNDSTVTIV